MTANMIKGKGFRGSRVEEAAARADARAAPAPDRRAAPHAYLAQCLKMLKERDDTIFMTGSEIADWYMAADPAPANL